MWNVWNLCNISSNFLKIIIRIEEKEGWIDEQIDSDAGVKMSAGKSMKKQSTEAWVTLATNDSYCLGAVVLANSLKRAGTTKNIVVMVTKQSISTPIL